MELDTGSVSVMSQNEFERNFKKAKLKPLPVKLKTYTSEPILPIGVMPVTVEYNDQCSELDLYIVQTEGPALWGRDWLRKLRLDWKSIKSLQVTVPDGLSTQRKLEKVLDCAATVFQPGMGTLKHIKGKITLKEDAVPKFHKARPIPYAVARKWKLSWIDWKLKEYYPRLTGVPGQLPLFLSPRRMEV